MRWESGMDRNLPGQAATKRSGKRWVVLVFAGTVAAAVIAGVGWEIWAYAKASQRREALELFRRGHYAQAEPGLQKALESDAQDVDLVRALALTELALGRSPEAGDFLDRWCSLQPERVEPFLRRMEYRERGQNRDLAIGDGRRILQLQPKNNLEMRRRVAGMMDHSGLHAETESICREGLAEVPHDPVLRYLLAEACHQQGKDVEAGVILDGLIQDGPQAGVLTLRGILYSKAGRYAEAIPLLRTALAQGDFDPQAAMARRYLAEALAHTGNAAEADKEMAEYLRYLRIERLLHDIPLQPENLDLKLKAAQSLIELGRNAEAADLVRQVLARNPDQPVAIRLQEELRKSRG
jgi:tetratricopeptide (TPR) repeat protein